MTVYPIALRTLEVLRVEDLTPALRRVTLTGDELGAFTTPNGIETAEFVSTGFDDDVRLFFPYPGESEPVLPTPRDGGLVFPKDPKPLGKNYTVRGFDPATRELDIDFIKHGVGVATTWAYRTYPGDRVHLAGPTASQGIPVGTDWLMVAGDDTAIPAIARLFEDLPADARAQVFIEVAESSLAFDLHEPPGVSVTWLPREGAPAGTTTLLLDAVRAAPWWEGTAFAWIAGEQSAVRDLRRHLVADRGLARDHISFTGYWKRQQVVSMADDEAVPDPERNEEAFERFHEQAEILPPIAIRLAADLEIGEHIGNGVTTPAALAAATGTDERALEKFLRYLHAIEILEPHGPGYRLSETGEFLTDVYVRDAIRGDGARSRRERALAGLGHSVRTGASGYRSVTGVDVSELLADPTYAELALENLSEFAPYLAVPLAQARAFLGVRHVVVRSAGSAAIAAELVRYLPGTTVDIADMPTNASWFRRDLPRVLHEEDLRARVTVTDAGPTEFAPGADAVLFVHELSAQRDADAALILRRAAASLAPGGRILLLEDTFDTEQLDEHAAENDLQLLTLYGSGHRTDTELDDVIAAAGLRTAETEAVGWGNILRTLVPTT
jgi:NADPH-dependent ferric siderophore reductase